MRAADDFEAIKARLDELRGETQPDTYELDWDTAAAGEGLTMEKLLLGRRLLREGMYKDWGTPVPVEPDWDELMKPIFKDYKAP